MSRYFLNRLHMIRFWTIPLTAALLLLSCAAPAQNLESSISKLKSHDDFRVRVQAALELGKSEDYVVRTPLEQALDDRKAAVRAAAAAALKAHGDRRALPALRAHLDDASVSVRAQIKASIQALERNAKPAVRTDPARLLVKLGSIKNGTQVKSGGLVGQLEQASREKLGRVPGVQVVEDSEDVNRTAKKKRLPAVMVTGRLRRLNASREGTDIVYSAMVDYVVHSMPEQSILSVLTGSASAKATPIEARDAHKMAELRALVLERAIESAMRRAPEALAAAMK
ncbi:MAG TPA: HEAT repeat domain-containing protein [Polyangiaceae bacterium]|nr:HEAT repeat domain-containing protein [Polyangiaceae bacterium]